MKKDAKPYEDPSGWREVRQPGGGAVTFTVTLTEATMTRLHKDRLDQITGGIEAIKDAFANPDSRREGS